MNTGITNGFGQLRYAISDCWKWGIIAYADGKGYSQRKYTDRHGWILLPHDEIMPPDIERELCKRLGLHCRLDPVQLADAPWITGPNE